MQWKLELNMLVKPRINKSQKQIEVKVNTQHKINRWS